MNSPIEFSKTILRTHKHAGKLQVLKPWSIITYVGYNSSQHLLALVQPVVENLNS